MSRIRIADLIGQERAGDAVYVAPLPDGPILVLQDSAIAIWEAVDGDGIDAIARRVGEMTGVDAPAVRDDVAHFVRTLVGRGLLVEY
ncbi:hypothetical protein GCM10022200_18450 [Microbacterium awajiense]|uniref:PqqD family protein n=1 Tax=Microbacterium awajiense TaxID=415214 RepID=A0ABP7AMF7_9MICO